MPGLIVFDPDKIAAPIGIVDFHAPFTTAIIQFNGLGFDQLIVFILREIANLVAAVIPPPAPLYLIQLNLYLAPALEQVTPGIHIGDIKIMVMAGKEHSRKRVAF